MNHVRQVKSLLKIICFVGLYEVKNANCIGRLLTESHKEWCVYEVHSLGSLIIMFVIKFDLPSHQDSWRLPAIGSSGVIWPWDLSTRGPFLVRT